MTRRETDKHPGPGWWCIHEECAHYFKGTCSHSDLPDRRSFKIEDLQMCPVLTDVEACIKPQKK